MTEEWRPVVGFEGWYEVSDKGRIRSLDRAWVQLSRHGTPYLHCKRGKILKPGRMPSGHLSVAVTRGNSLCVHDLVLTAFRGARPDGFMARHLNGNPADNRIANLVWSPRGPNEQDKKWHHTPRGCLSAGVALEVKLALHRGERRADIAARFGVSVSTIHLIKHGKVHADVQFAP